MPEAPAPTDDFRYPGNRLGLPEDGPGSVAGWGRRLVALFVDWLVAWLIASLVVQRPMLAGGNDLSFAVLLTFCLMSTVLVGIALLRSVLIALVIPPVVYDRDRRGLHDMAAGTVVVLR